jgi:oligoribonuclease NrnB/cAMP/cGMP phosphodiesterase (DHH superfamily)
VNIQVWTDTDLHGAGAALVLKWLYKDAKTFSINDVTEYTFTGKFKGAMGSLDHYDRVYIVDLDLTPEQIKLADYHNVVVIDTHKNHIKNKHLYSKAKAILEGYPDHGHTSTVDLIYNKFGDHLLHLTDEQLLLIEYIGTYDWYNTQYKESLKLNAIYYNLNSPKTENFISAFSDGFRDFTVHEKNAIKLYFKKFKDQIENGDVFRGNIKGYNIVASFGNYAVGELAHFLIKKYNADIGIIVNTQAKAVSFRRSKLCDADVSVLAKNLCQGGGHTSSAGGKLTEQFAALTKQFSPC